MTWWKEQTPKTQRILIGGALGMFALTLGVWFYLDRSTLWDTPKEAAPSLTENPLPLAPTSLHQDEPSGVTLTENRSLSSLGGEPIALGLINGIPFDVRSERIVNLQTGESNALPEPIRLATAMDDLDALFLVGQSGALYIYTVTNKKFEQNSLPLPNGGTIDALGTYLTYLYVLDRKASSIYRFPRTEGGFGTPITWSKETLTLHPVTPLSVFENVAMVLPDGHPALYSRGRKTEASFTGTRAPIEIKSLVIDPKNGDVLALDPKQKRVVRWSATGTLIAQYFHDMLADAGALQITSNNELLIARPSGTFAFPLP